MIADDAITTAKIVDGAVTAAKLTDGAGSGVDADLLDGQHGTNYENTITMLNATSDITLSTSEVVIPGMSGSFNAGTYLVIATVPLSATGTSGQIGNTNVRCRVNAVVQNGHAHHSFTIGAGLSFKYTAAFVWRVVLPSTQTIDITAYQGGGTTCTIVTTWQLDKAAVVKINP
ncbi:hypothetical protein AC477_01135 [miscellaneous Crenarchaeota group-1 archaeon SG8-32-1]|uniref:Uncharacterized protein n=1 Tax=miscellaneous Crenarchaeota group-1 archaeon SG8-32-1 TaxID=1685124 RepID=A0A0M0BZK6_9ARCH|nr:MAG: hypothetical protein AC477_01135 [miscellaneous Crenarchaeota group-1 archaeon SG8-32-1]